jgi:hypothetical protein
MHLALFNGLVLKFWTDNRESLSSRAARSLAKIAAHLALHQAVPHPG